MGLSPCKTAESGMWIKRCRDKYNYVAMAIVFPLLWKTLNLSLTIRKTSISSNSYVQERFNIIWVVVFSIVPTNSLKIITSFRYKPNYTVDLPLEKGNHPE